MRWRLLSWLENPSNPARSSHTEGRKTGTCHTEKKKTVEREGGTQGGGGEEGGTASVNSLHIQENANAQENMD